VWNRPFASFTAFSSTCMIANGPRTRYTQWSDARERVDTFRMTRGLPTCERALFFLLSSEDAWYKFSLATPIASSGRSRRSKSRFRSLGSFVSFDAAVIT
jgi:hypothetical protein